VSTNTQFFMDLHNLKEKVSFWAREHKKVNVIAIRTLEAKLKSLYTHIQGGHGSSFELDIFQSLEGKIYNILLE